MAVTFKEDSTRQWFSKFSMHKNHLGNSLNMQYPGLHPQIIYHKHFWWICSLDHTLRNTKWERPENGAWHKQVMLMSLVAGVFIKPHLSYHFLGGNYSGKSSNSVILLGSCFSHTHTKQSCHSQQNQMLKKNTNSRFYTFCFNFFFCGVEWVAFSNY